MTPEEVVAAQLAAYNKGDIDAFVSCYIEDVPVCSFPSGEVLDDRSGRNFRERYRQLFESTPELHAELVSRVVHGRFVVDQELVTGFPTGEVRRAGALYEVHNGLISRVWFMESD